MPLTPGTWKAVINGVDIDLVLGSPDARGVVPVQFGPFTMRGMWDESSQMLTFAWLVNAGLPDPILGVFTGYLFRAPRNPAPGQDQIATLAGTVTLAVNSGGGPNQMFPESTPRRHTFGWLAHLTEVI